jgi:hypothetical protein
MNKKLLSAMFFAASASVANAQFTQANEPVINDGRQMYLLDSTTIDYSAVTGNTAVWDYSAAVNENSVANNMRMISIIAPPTSNYPGATKAMEIEGYATSYFSSTATERVSQGFSFPEPTLGLIETKFSTNSEQLFTYPLAYNGTFTDATIAGNLEFAFSGAPTVAPATGTMTVKYDGLGTLMFPNGTSTANVSRVKSVDSFTATVTIGGFITIPVLLTRTQFEYYNLASGGSLPIFIHSHVNVINSSDNSVLSNFSVVLSSTPSTARLIDAEFASLSVYPNPASDVINVTGIDVNGSTATLVDQLGRTIATQSLVNGSTSFDVASLDAGIYVMNIVANGKTTSKLVTVK